MPTNLASTLVVVPALNEEESVRGVVIEIRAAAPAATVLVVDDGSSDRTASEAIAGGALVARLPFNLGVGGAMRVGFRYASENGFNCVVQVDADGQHNPVGIAALVTELDHADIVIGARFAGEGDYVARGPRRLAMLVLSQFISRVAGTRLTDTTSGFRASGPRAISLFADHYPAEYLGDTIESLIIASRARLVVRQVPVSMRPRAGGRPSHNPLRSTVYLGRAMMALVVAFMHPPVSVSGEVRES